MRLARHRHHGALYLPAAGMPEARKHYGSEPCLLVLRLSKREWRANVIAAIFACRAAFVASEKGHR